MRGATVSTVLVLCLCANGCAGTTVEARTIGTTAASTNEVALISASQLLETMQWPPDLRPIALSPGAKHQLQRFILDDLEVAATVSALAAIGLTRGGQSIGAILLIGVTDPVIGNMSFVEGLRAAAVNEPDDANWGPMGGSVTSSNGQVWGILPLSSVVVVAVGATRSDLDDIMNALVLQFTRP